MSTIQYVHYKGFDAFEDAAYESIYNLESELDELNNRFEEEQQRINEIEENRIDKTRARSLDEQEDVYMELIEIGGDRQSTLDQLLALSEMKIIYMFKNLEIAMKSLIKTAYPKTKTNDFYKWESMVSFFKNINIPITDIDGYQECTDLKKINNNIKHSDDLSDEVKKIPEFGGDLFLSYSELNIFYDRVKPKVVLFFDKLNKAVVDDLFVFPDERIDSIATSYIERMDKETAIKFVEVLTEKIKV